MVCKYDKICKILFEDSYSVSLYETILSHLRIRNVQSKESKLLWTSIK